MIVRTKIPEAGAENRGDKGSRKEKKCDGGNGPHIGSVAVV
jgi:hypothetical protein